MSDFLLRAPGGRYFYHRGKKYSVGRAGRRTRQLLRDISSSPECQSARGLLALRPRIRDALAYPRPVSLSFVIDRSRNTRVLRIAIWMLGRIGHPYATKSVARHVNHPSFPVRREVIRALHRLHAWTDLRRIELEHADPRIRALARPISPKDYSHRLARFVTATKPIETAERHRDVVIDPEVEIGAGRPAKSSGRIAAVLRRIHRLVQQTRRRRNVLLRRMWRRRYRSH